MSRGMDIDKEVRDAWIVNLRAWALKLTTTTFDARKRGAFDSRLVAEIRKVEDAAIGLFQYLENKREGR